MEARETTGATERELRNRWYFWLICLAGQGVLTYVAVRTGGVRSPAFSGVLTVAILANLLMGYRAAMFFLGLTLLEGLLLIGGERLGMLPAPPSLPAWVALVVQMSLLLATLGVLHLMVRHTAQSMRRLQREISEREYIETMLRENEARYRMLFENAGDAIFIMRRDRFIDCNPKTLEIFGCTREQIIGQPPYRFSPKFQPDGRNSREAAQQYIAAALAGTPQRFDWRHIRCDGNPLDVEVSLNRIEVAGEALIQAIVRDMTKRIQVEAARRERLARVQRQQRAIVELATCEAIVNGEWSQAARTITEAAARVMDVERVSVWLLEQAGEELVCVDLFLRREGTHTHGDAVGIADAPAYFAALDSGRAVDAFDVYHDPRTRELEPYLRQHGITSMLDAAILIRGELAGVVCHEHTGEPRRWHADEIAFAGAVADQAALALMNAERRRTEETLQRRNRDLTVLNRVISTATSTLDTVQILRVLCGELALAFNLTHVVAMLLEPGATASKVVAEYCAPGVPSSLGMTIPLEQIALASVLKQRQPLLVSDAQIVDVSGSLRGEVCRMRGTTLLLVPLVVRDRVFSVIGLCASWTRSYSAEDMELIQNAAAAAAQALEVAELHNELRSHAEVLERIVEQRTHELRAALQQARAADEAKSRFISNVSHELRTPLTSIRLYLRLLERGRRGEWTRYLDSLSREAERLQALIESILTISKLDAGHMQVELRPMDLNHLLQVLATDREPLFIRRGLLLHLDLAENLPHVWADPKLIEQVVTNLLTNAMNYTPSGGEVRLRTALFREDGRSWVTFSVQDTGPGIPAEEREHLFERFYRGSAGYASKAPGTGLGLSICKEIVDLHRGRITVESIPRRGSTFTVWLPYTAEPHQEEHDPHDQQDGGRHPIVRAHT